jgi:hypothetical protein
MCWARSCCASNDPFQGALELLKVGRHDEFERLDNHVMVRIRRAPIFFGCGVKKRFGSGAITIHKK